MKMVLVYFPTASYGSAWAYRNSAKEGADVTREISISGFRDKIMTAALRGFDRIGMN